IAFRYAPCESWYSLLFLSRNSACKLLLRDAAQSADFARDHLCLTRAIRTGSTTGGEICAMDGSASPRRLRVFNRVQHTSRAAPLGARKKYALAHCNGNVSDLAHFGPIGRPDGSFSRTVAGQSRRSRKLVVNFHSGNRCCYRTARASGSHTNRACGRNELSGFPTTAA